MALHVVSNRRMSGETIISFNEFAVDVLRGRGRWDPKIKGWYVALKHRDDVYEELSAI